MTNNPAPVPASRTEAWRGLLEDLRVQVALAEMELRDASEGARAAAEETFSAVTDRLNAAVGDVSGLVTRLRDEMRRVTS